MKSWGFLRCCDQLISLLPFLLFSLATPDSVRRPVNTVTIVMWFDEKRKAEDNSLLSRYKGEVRICTFALSV